MEVGREDVGRRLIHGGTENLGRHVRKLLHELALRGRRQRRRCHRVLEHRDRVTLEGMRGNLLGREKGLNLLALHGDTVRALDGASGLREQVEVQRATTTTNRAATPVEKVELDARLFTDRHQLLHGHVQLPQRGELAGVLGGVRVAEHHLVLPRDDALVRGHLENALHDSGRVEKIVTSLEEGRDAHRRLDSALFLEQADREHVRRVVRHRDAVRAHALGGQLGEHVEDVEHLAHVRVPGGRVGEEHVVRRDEWPFGEQFRFEPGDLLLLVPLSIAAQFEEAGDRIERLRVPIRLLSHV